MSILFELVVYGKAESAGSKVAGVTNSGRRFVRDDNPNSREWKRAVAQAAGERMDGRPVLEWPLDLSLVFYRPRPKGHYGKSGVRTSAPRFPTTRPDVLKLARAVEDALTGVVWRDDSQVVLERLEKRYGDPSRVEIVVRSIAAEGAADEGGSDAL